MERKEYKRLEMKAYEAFIRRASQINLPFMLKGSYVTRQYFSNPNDRIPADLDWVYLGTIKDESTARKNFNEWVTLITESEVDDGVTYRSFKENEFWRRIDYAMSDDFPTVNTDLECWVDGEKLVFGLDVSFNLDIDQQPVEILYQPIEGKPFLISNTVPISLQVSWKIHQTLVRPRFKDLFDLIYLVQHATFDEKQLEHAMQALINECHADKVDLIKLKYFLNYEMDKLFPKNSIEETWDLWRHNIDKNNYSGGILFDKAEYYTDVTKLPIALAIFLTQFKNSMQHAGFRIELFKNLPTPTRRKRKSFEDNLTSPNL
ncbi:MAG: nucleotidyl transferase AbiEii/AbiGii toxin family protein [Bacteroidia bacterium]